MPAIFAPLNDEPTLDIESLAPRRQLLTQLRETILACTPPQVLGIHGDWGSGKTSFLHRLMFEITGECSGNSAAKRRAEKAGVRQKKQWDDCAAVAVWFEAWRYQHDDLPVVALLNEIRARFSRPRKFWDQVNKTVAVATTSTLFGFDAITKYLGFSPEKIQQQGEAWEREQRTNPLPTQDVRKLLEEAVEKLLASQNATLLLIFIDDLDRCSSTAVLRLLEGIKIYLNVRRCIFILGINQHEIERAIARELSKNETDKEAAAVRAQEYLEKLCGHLIRLPSLDQGGQRVLLSQYIKNLIPAELRDAILDLLADADGKPKYDFLPPNPRRLKNFANTILRLVVGGPILDPASTDRHARAVCIVASLHAFHPELHSALQKSPTDFWKTLQAFCTLSFQGAADARRAADEQPHKRLCHINRPYGATPLPVGAEQPVPPWLGVTFSPLFADPASLDTLFCQQLIADSALETADLMPFLTR